jgi:hypothetical protein
MAEWKLCKRHIAYVIGRDGAGRVSGHKLDLHSNVPEQILVLASESWSCNRKAERQNQIADTHKNTVPGDRNPPPCATTTGLILQQLLQAAASREVFFPPTENLVSPAALERGW